MIRILIVDDEKLERDALRLMLNKGLNHPIEIDEAPNGREAIVLAEAQPPDLVLMDIRMPGIDGLEAARQIRTIQPGAYFVFITAFNQFEYAQEAIKVGVEDYLIKPVGESQLLEVAARLTEKILHKRQERISNRDAELRIRTMSGYLEHEFLYHLCILGMEREKFEDYCSVLGMSIVRGWIAIMFIDFASYPLHVESDYQRQVLSRRCAGLVSRLLRERGYESLFNFDLAEPFFLVYQDSAQNPGDFVLLREELTAAVRNQLEIGLYLGVGTLFTDPVDSVQSYAVARRNLQGEHPGALQEDLDGQGYRESHHFGRQIKNLPLTWEEETAGLGAVEPALLHMKTSYMKDISLEEVAELCGVSPYYFTRIFKRATGTTFVDYLTSLRIEHARALLEGSREPVSRICRQVGFRDPNYFTRVFRRTTGLSPREYRRRIVLKTQDNAEDGS